MIERFLEILRYSFETYQDSLVLNSAKFQNPNLSVEVSLHFDDEKDNFVEKHGVWRFTCSKVREHKIVFGDCLFYDFVGEFTEDILKWKYEKPCCSVSFYGKPENPLEIIGKLYEIHTKIVGNQIPFDSFFNMSSELEKLVSSGFGLLAENVPQPLAVAYKDVLESFGISANASETGYRHYWNGEIFTNKAVPLCLLVLGESVIVAENIDAEEISNRKV